MWTVRVRLVYLSSNGAALQQGVIHAYSVIVQRKGSYANVELSSWTNLMFVASWNFFKAIGKVLSSWSCRVMLPGSPAISSSTLNIVGNAAASLSIKRHAMFPCRRICLLSARYALRFCVDIFLSCGKTSLNSSTTPQGCFFFRRPYWPQQGDGCLQSFLYVVQSSRQ